MRDKTIKSRDDKIISSGVSLSGQGTQRADQAVISSGYSTSGATQPQVSQVILSGVVMNPGSEIILNDNKYIILQVVNRSTGEAEVYLMERGKERFIFKLYYPNFKPKDTILQQLKGLHHEDIVDLLDYGYLGDRFFEIMEYAEGGSLTEKREDGTYKYLPIKDREQLKQIVRETVNALEYCHTKGIIHRDIKPENLFYKNANGTDILVGDFGISSALEEGMSRRLTSQSLTVGYAAPELYGYGGKAIIGKEVDYYAFGFTIIHFWLGNNPFEGLGIHAISNLTTSGRVDIPTDMPEDLKTLVKGLITIDYHHRWGYKEVQKWLAGEHVPVHYKVIEKTYSDFHFGFIDGEEVVINDPVELARLLEKYPQQGKKHLYKGTIQKWVENVDQSLYVDIRGIVEDDYPTDENAGLQKAIYILDPGKNYKSFSGVECKTAEEIGDALEKENSYYRNELTKNLKADFYLFLEARESRGEADTFRKYAKTYQPERALNTIILELQGKDRYKIDNIAFFKPEDLLSADDSLKDKIVQYLVNPDSKLSIWLEQYSELKGNIDKWRKLGRHNRITLFYALEKKSPFHFEDELAYTLDDFRKIFSKKLLNKAFLEKATAVGSQFVEEADFWLNKYQDTNYLEIIREYLEKGISNENKDGCIKIIKYILNTNPDKDYYWDKIESIVNNGYKLGLIDEATINIQKKYLESRKNEFQIKFEKKLNELKTDLVELKSYNFQILSEELISIKILLTDAEDKITRAESQWDRESYKAVQKSINFLYDIEKIIQKLKLYKDKAKKEYEDLKERKARARKTIGHSVGTIIGSTVSCGFLFSLAGCVYSCITYISSDTNKDVFEVMGQGGGNGFWLGVIVGVLLSTFTGLKDYFNELKK